jgi:hypothetical protein
VTTTPRSLPLVALVLAFAVIGVNARLIVGGKTWADARYHTEIAPPRLAAAETVQYGIFPGWWDGTGLGVPLAAEPSHGALYPPTWLAATPTSFDLLGLIHLVWAALGVAVWARRRPGSWAPHGATEPAAVVAGLLVVTSGLLASAALRGALPALAHLPWLGVAAAWLGEATDRRDRTRAAIVIGVLLGLVGLSGVFAGLVDATLLVLALAARRRVAGYLAAAVVGGLAIGAAQWLPAMLQLGDEAGAQIRGLPFARLVELIVPGSFGALDPDRSVAAIAGGAAWAPSIFVGAPLLALSAVRPPARRLLGVILTLATLTLVVGRGGWPSWLGAPELHLAVLVIVLAPRAAAGLDALVTGDRRATIALCVGGACAGVALGALGALRSRHPEAAPAIDRALLDGGLGLVCIAAALALVWRAPGRAMPVLLALLVLPSVGAAPSLAPVIDRALVAEPGAWAQAARAQATGLAPLRVYRPEFMFEGPNAGGELAGGRASLERSPDMRSPRSEPETIEDSLATFAGTSAWKWGLAAARSEDPARPRIHDRAWLAAARGGGVLLDRFGISLAILPETMVASLKVTPLGQRGGWVLAPLPVAPPASVMRGWMWAVAPEDAFALMFPMGGRAVETRGTTVLRGGGPSQPDRGPPLPCTVERWDPGDLAFTCTSDAAGYAVVSSTAAPGWTVTVDDDEAAWLTADVLRRAVAIPAGTHHVHWRYHTPGSGLGLAIAAIGAALLVALGLASRLSRT